MTSDPSELWEGPIVNSSSPCHHNLTLWEHHMEKMYTYFYLLLFIPGLVLNSVALWVLCRYISKKTKAVIFMINLAFADLIHILSLPLRIYYYFTHTWPFGQSICLFCFYLKYLNMYAAIVFLVCISVQRCVFLLNPFSARNWRRRYDLMISLMLWILVSLACSPFILMRSSSVSNPSLNFTAQQNPTGTTKLYPTPLASSLRLTSLPSSESTNVGCFKDLPMRRLPLPLVLTMLALAELFGFFIPLACITYSSARITYSLKKKTEGEQHATARGRLQSFNSGSDVDKVQEKQTSGEKQRALRMVLSCCVVFMLCFAPYHINFMLYLMVSQGILTHCPTQLVVRLFHPFSLCLASLSCCLNPLLYYFLTAEFRLHLKRRTSSFSSSHMYSPIGSPRQRLPLQRLTSEESTCSGRE